MVSNTVHEDNQSVDSYVGHARLEWWANSDTCLGAWDVNLTVTVDDAGWHASATFDASPQGEEREGWSFLMRLDPHFTVRFLEDEEATILVRVDEEPPEGRLLLTEVTATGPRSAPTSWSPPAARPLTTNSPMWTSAR